MKQAVALYDSYQEQIKQCDREIELVLMKLSAQKAAPSDPLPKRRSSNKREKNGLDFDVQPVLYRLAGST
jgi:hypothetical protein